MGEDLVHEGGDFAVPVSDQIARPAARIVQVHHQILYRLDDPVRARVSSRAKHAGAPGGVLDDGQDVLALPVEGDGLDEIAGQ
ncbi:hypothetical protein [Nonomuraea sp. NPDC005650]|uniref:hypothetical protein n=1 Tax=Nonomuraea sp. NPDC005650 TaxID=3157045 RepID=UPI00339E24E8